MKTACLLVVPLALAAGVVAVQSAAASNSPDMRLDYGATLTHLNAQTH